MQYWKVSDAADKWGLSPRRVRLLCEQEKIEGVIRDGRTYLIPENAEKPVDGRILRAKAYQGAFSALFTSLDTKKEALSRRRPLTKGELERLREEFLIDFTYNSNAIEGNTLTLKETALVLEGVTIDQKPLKDHLEAVGHRDAFLYVQDVVSQSEPLTETVIKRLHSLVLMDRPDDRGVYRRVPVRIMGAFTVPVQPYLIEPKMNELLTENKKRQKEMHPVERAAWFHLVFEGIHPFIDGNGRTGRLILNLDLMQNGYPPVNIKFTDRRRYYDAFDAYYRDDNAAPMIKLLAEYTEERLVEYLSILEPENNS